MKKKQKANLIMVAIILGIIISGILCVGMIQGKFDQDDGTKAVLSDIRGIINLERDGVILTVQDNTVLRAGDRLINYPGATANVKVGNTKIVFGDQAQLEILDPNLETFHAVANNGEFFVNATQKIQLDFEDKSLTLSDSVSYLSVRTGSQSIGVLEGTVENAQAGQMIHYLSDEIKVSELSIQALNEFTMNQIRSANVTKNLCFTNQQLDQLEAQRKAEQLAMMNQAKDSAVPLVTIGEETEEPEETEPVTEPEETESYDDTEPDETEETMKPTEKDEPEETNPPETKITEPEETDPPEAESTEPEQTEPATVPTAESTEPQETVTEPKETEQPAAEPEDTEPPTTEPENCCTITIVCDTILNNWDMLDPAKAGYVPNDGVILDAVSVEFEEGETVFDVLKRVCEAMGIQLEYSWTPLYDSYYIEGINHLYEFDVGGESGWMYKVNGWFPNYGCSGYTLHDGDVIVWCYTCIGLGVDVGGSNWS